MVLGAGAVGGSLGGLLFDSGTEVAWVARGDHAAAMRRAGLKLQTPEGQRVLSTPIVELVAEVEWRAGDVALLATKLNDAEALLDELRTAAGPTVPVVCATNGVHAERWAAARFDTVLSCFVWVAAVHLAPGEVRLHSRVPRGVLDTGPYRGDAGLELSEAFCSSLRGAGFEAVARADIARWKHAKWITNLGGAAQALVEDDWQRVAATAREEGLVVLAAAGLEHASMEELERRVSKVQAVAVDGREREGGSTWQSRARGRPLESAWIEGAMAELAAEVGVAVPVLSRLARAALAPRSMKAAEVLGE